MLRLHAAGHWVVRWMAGLAIAAAGASAQAQPVTTILTHGYTVGEKGAWVEGMAAAIIARVGSGSVYRYFGSGAGGGVWTYVPTPFSDGSVDAVVCIFNWVDESAGVDAGPNWNYAQAAGDALYAALRDPRYVGAIGTQLPDLTAGRALHFIGHSRGACVNDQAILRCARDGVAVDHCTTLDPHPVDGTLDPPLNFDWNDPTPRRWSNVEFHDNYWRADGGGFSAVDFDGISVFGAFNTMLNESALNCCAYSQAHSDVHLWLHGTIDLAPAACDGEQCINATMRSTWWPEGYAQRGWFYSILGGGNALRPGVGPPSDPPPLNFVVNGDFENATYAGWLYHGGAVGGQIVNEGGAQFLKIGAGVGTSALARHNRLYAPAGASDVELDTRVIVAASPGQSLRIMFTDLDGVNYVVADDAIATVAGGWVVDRRFAIPIAVPRGRAYTLTLQIVSTGAATAVIGVDNVDLVVAPPLTGDVDGDGCVDIDDLLAVIAAWGPCPAPPNACPADVVPTGSIDIDDLLTVISAWGCG